ncbi:MAG: glycosyltransferase family 2 protein, partial [Candidatus Blackburnbacteria bacterium]|nr:glycosyltransferase family 2 protein [Candidatus Blackburnbacteria bacterium]
MKKIDLSIVILSYNTKDFLLGCLQSIKEADLGEIKTEIIVVDNASIDGSGETARESIKSITSTTRSTGHSTVSSDRIGSGQAGITGLVIENRRNLGFAAGNNIGVKKSTGRYVLFLNPDTVLSGSVLQEVFGFMEKYKDVAVASPRLELPTGELDEASHRGFPTPWNAFCHFSGLRKIFPRSKIFAGYTIGWLLGKSTPHEVGSVSGAFFFVRREAGKKVGWWDEDYFWYGDELDFCYRLKEKGWKIFFLPQVKVLHYRGVASGIKGHSR